MKIKPNNRKPLKSETQHNKIESDLLAVADGQEADLTEEAGELCFTFQYVNKCQRLFVLQQRNKLWIGSIQD